jgi:hypothetical protein
MAREHADDAAEGGARHGLARIHDWDHVRNFGRNHRVESKAAVGQWRICLEHCRVPHAKHSSRGAKSAGARSGDVAEPVASAPASHVRHCSVAAATPQCAHRAVDMERWRV